MKFQQLLFFLIYFTVASIFAQQSTHYSGEREKRHLLEHTKLKVDFNFKEKQLNGEAWITLKPYFFPTDKLILDAKGMLIHQVVLGDKKLDFNYDGFELRIDLPKKYTKEESYTVYIKYTARPEKVKQRGSLAISAAKGLYFINADGTDKNKPTQIWTQGETEASSCWFPTIDSPNQKSSQEIYLTVPNQYQTLSNGVLVSQIKKGANRTD